MKTVRLRIVQAFLLVALLAPRVAFADHPELLVSPADHDAIAAKLRDCDWAKTRYEKLKSRVDAYLKLSGDDPQWMSSRLAMNWQTRYVTPVCEKSRYVGGEGHAALPTPRFAGARDWATKYAVPDSFEELKPFNDTERGQIWLHNKETNTDEWTDPAATGRVIELINSRIMQLAADASFVYWITGDERYARFAAPVLWQYMNGFAQVTAPKIPPDDRSMSSIIGMTSFEVIHEDIVTPLSVSYDFLHDYLKAHDFDVAVIQTGLKRMIDRVIDGGSREGNWNLNQARIITYGCLALEPDENYTDDKGRQHYVDLVLNADLPHQLGVSKVIHHALDEQTALWPEAAGYGFGSAKDIALIATLVGNDPVGGTLLGDPILARNAIAQASLTYPNGIAVGLGDTTDTRVNATLLELLTAAARLRGNGVAEAQVTAMLAREITSGTYDRGAPADDLVALTKYVADLKPAGGNAPDLPRTFYGKPLNVFMQRNVGDDPVTSLAAAIYGTAGGHVHANGLAIELYGAGCKLGADPGRGESYWTADHAEYYSQPPAHNTVIVNGRSNYAVGRNQIGMTIEQAEPMSNEPALSPDISFAECLFKYEAPQAEQQRTLAVIRTGPEAGFYFDVFRSRAVNPTGSFHDYIYHDVAQDVSISTAAGAKLTLDKTSKLDPQVELLKGYSYFKNERSIEFAGDFHARFSIDHAGAARVMNLWMAGQSGRTLFAVDAPPNHGARGNPAAPNPPVMPTLIVRQSGDAWDKPFVSVFEPSLNDGAGIKIVRAIDSANGLAACVVDGKDFNAVLMQDDQAVAQREVEGVSFRGNLGVVLSRGGQVAQLYLGNGLRLARGAIFVAAADDKQIGACLRRDGSGWRCSASGRVRVGVTFAEPAGTGRADEKSVLIGTGNEGFRPDDLHVTFEKAPDGSGQLIVTCTLAAGRDISLRMSDDAHG